MATTEQLAVDAIRELNARMLRIDGTPESGGSPWRLIRRLSGGSQSGAWLVDDPSGASAVLKVATTVGWSEQVARAERAVRTVRRRGYPTPEWRAHGVTDAGLAFQVQEFVTGSTVDVVDVPTARALVGLIERQAGLEPDPDRNWNDFAADQLGSALSDLERASAAAGPPGQILLDLCAAMSLGAAPDAWPSTDMVHGDLRPVNVLFDRGEVAGVVDIEAIGSGTRAFDYATLLSVHEIEDEAVPLIIDAGVRAAGAAVLRACVAVVLLDLVRFVTERNGDSARLVGDLSRRAELVHRRTRSE